MPRDPYLYAALMGLSDFFILVACVTVAIFVFIYTHRFDWRSTVPGRSTAYFLMSLVAILVLIGLSRGFGPEYFGREWLRVIVYGAVAFTSIRMLVALLGYYRKPAEERDGFLPDLKPEHEESTTNETEITP